jgi:hypothetical protein
MKMLYAGLAAALLTMPHMAEAQGQELMAAITCAAMTEALESPDAGWWRALVTRSVGSSEKARVLIDETARLITDNINNGLVGLEEVNRAVAECKAARKRGS